MQCATNSIKYIHNSISIHIIEEQSVVMDTDSKKHRGIQTIEEDNAIKKHGMHKILQAKTSIIFSLTIFTRTMIYH